MTSACLRLGPSKKLYLHHAYSWFSSDIANIQHPKSQGLLGFYLHLAKDLLKINFHECFPCDSIFCFKNIALSNFPSLLCVTLIWRPRRPSHMLKIILLHDKICPLNGKSIRKCAQGLVIKNRRGWAGTIEFLADMILVAHP